MSNPDIRRPLDGALWALSQGWKVFPVIPGGKAPRLQGWQAWAARSTPQIVQDYARSNPSTNWGIACEQSGLLVVDLDMADGKQGETAWAALCAQHGGAPLTTELRTARGGRHLCFSGNGPNSASLIAQDVDTRGQGGLIVCPGSVLRDSTGMIQGTYSIAEVRPTAPAPAWLLDLLKVAKKEPLKRPDDNEVVGSIPSGQRDNTLARWAGMLRGQGLVQEELLAALAEINRVRCSPPMEDAEVERIASSISRKPRGEAEALAGFAAVLNPQAAVGVLPLYSGAAILERNIPEPEQVLADFADAGDVLGLFAKSKARKSWLALQLACCAATGREFLGWSIGKPRKVLLVQTEVKRDHYEKRIQRVAKGLGISDLSNLRVLHARGLSLTIDQIANEALACEAQCVIIDPIYPLIQEENSAEGIKPLLAKLSQLAERGILVAYVHHDKKGKSGDLDLVDRGSGSGVLGRAYDCALFLDEHATDKAAQVLRSITRNYPPADDKVIRWSEFTFHLDEHAPAEVETTSSASAKAKRGRPAEELAEQARHVLETRKDWPRLRAETTLQNALAIGERKARDVLHLLAEQGDLEVQTGRDGAKIYTVSPKASDIFA